MFRSYNPSANSSRFYRLADVIPTKARTTEARAPKAKTDGVLIQFVKALDPVFKQVPSRRQQEASSTFANVRAKSPLFLVAIMTSMFFWPELTPALIIGVMLLLVSCFWFYTQLIILQGVPLTSGMNTVEKLNAAEDGAASFELLR